MLKVLFLFCRIAHCSQIPYYGIMTLCRAVLGILYLLIYPNVIDLAIDLPSEKASVSFPECIL